MKQQKMIPNVEPILPRIVPAGYRLGIDGIYFSKEKLEEKLPDGTRKLLTLDISISPDEFVRQVNCGQKELLTERVNQFYGTICPNNCPGCFEKGDVRNSLLSFNNVKDYLEQAVDLGLESVKFLGPGELITNPKLFEILEYFQRKNIKIGIFTKGETLGEDELARKYQGMSSEDLVRRVCNYDVTRVLIDCRTFDGEKSNRLTRSQSKNYVEARNRAIELLVNNGLNQDLFCQRMQLQANPVTPSNIEEVLEIFKYGTERNMPVEVTPTMLSGQGKCILSEVQTPEFQERLIQLYTEIYTYLIDRGVMTFAQLREEGVSSYAGTAPCNQLSSGMFIRKDGVVQRCPGNDNPDHVIYEDVRRKPLKEIWIGSQNYALGPMTNNKCVKDGYSIPHRLYDEVLERLK